MIRQKRRLMHPVNAPVMRFVQHHCRPQTSGQPQLLHRRPHAAVMIMPRPVQRRMKLRVPDDRRREASPVPVHRHLHVSQRCREHHAGDPARNQNFLQPRLRHSTVVQPKFIQRTAQFLGAAFCPRQTRLAKSLASRVSPRRTHPDKRQPLPVRRTLRSPDARHKRPHPQIRAVTEPLRHRLHALRRRRFHERTSPHRQRRRGQRHARLARHFHQ
ncbi:hypothetical protein RAHE111665_14520 [Rariglobus hedericola]